METRHQVYLTDSSNLREIRADHVDLVVTSPPYPMIEMWDELFSKIDLRIEKALRDRNDTSAFNLMHEFLNKVWSELSRVVKPGGFVCINVGDATRKIDENFKLYSNHAKIIECFRELGFDVLPPIIWRKQSNKPTKFMGSGMLPAGAYVTLEHEYVLIFRKGAKRFFSEEEKHMRRQSAIFWEERNEWFSDIWFDLKGASQSLTLKANRERSAAYPLELALRLINMYSIMDDIILDPFLGTGTTSIAAALLRRNSIGYEVDKSFEATILSRFENLISDSKLVCENRLSSHLQFVESRMKNGQGMKYISKFYGCPVVSSQETDIQLFSISSINHASENSFVTFHRPFQYNSGQF